MRAISLIERPCQCNMSASQRPAIGTRATYGPICRCSTIRATASLPTSSATIVPSRNSVRGKGLLHRISGGTAQPALHIGRDLGGCAQHRSGRNRGWKQVGPPPCMAGVPALPAQERAGNAARKRRPPTSLAPRQDRSGETDRIRLQLFSGPGFHPSWAQIAASSLDASGGRSESPGGRSGRSGLNRCTEGAGDLAMKVSKLSAS